MFQLMHPPFPWPVGHKALCSMLGMSSWIRPSACSPSKQHLVRRARIELWTEIKTNRAGVTMTCQWFICSNFHHYVLEAQAPFMITQITWYWTLSFLSMWRRWTNGVCVCILAGTDLAEVVPTLKKMKAEDTKLQLNLLKWGSFVFFFFREFWL